MSYDGNFIRFQTETGRFQLPEESTEPYRIQTTGKRLPMFQNDTEVIRRRWARMRERIRRATGYAVENEVALIIAIITAVAGLAGGIYLGRKIEKIGGFTRLLDVVRGKIAKHIP